MARKTVITVPHRRKRQGKTDYKRRLSSLLSDKPRFVVRKTPNNIHIQIVNYEAKGDKVIVYVHGNDLHKLGWNFGTGNTPSAYLTGYMAGKNAVSKGIKEAILDIGLQAQSERLYAALKGAVDAGLMIPHDKKIIPKQDRLDGKHIAAFFESVKEGQEFGDYRKKNLKVADIKTSIEKVKENIK